MLAMRRMFPLALALALLAACSRGPADPPGWARLANGLRVCVRKVEGATNVAVLTVFAIGSDHDPVGKSGLAHLTEHLYVSSAAGATRARTSTEWFAAHPDGGSAATSETFTHVLTVVAPEALDAELSDAAARMGDVRIEPADLERERASVLKQVAEHDAKLDAVDRAWRAAIDRLRPLPNGGHGVGTKEQVEKLSLDDVRERARRFYKPANARLVVAGAVDEVAARALIEKSFAGVASGERIGDPEPPGPSRPGTVELPDDNPPQSGAPREQAVCVAYPASWSTARDAAAAVVLASRAMPSPELYAVPREDSMTFTQTVGARSVDEVLRRIDALVSGIAVEAPTAAELSFARKYLPNGVVDDTIAAADAKQRAALVAGRIASSARDRFDLHDVGRAIESLTQADLERYAKEWFDPAKRVVVVAWGAPQPKPVAPPLKPSDVAAHREATDVQSLAEVRVVMRWDETTQTVRRKIGDRELPEDADLQKAIADAHVAWAKTGKPDAPVSIDADARVPWKDVIDVVNVIKRCGIQKIEFASGAPRKTPAQPK